MEILSAESIKKWLKDLPDLMRLAYQILRSKDWFKILVLIGVLLLVFLIALKFFLGSYIPSHYEPYALWTGLILLIILLLILILAFIIGVRTKRFLPAPPPPDRRSPIKGLLAFDTEDEEVFARLQRDKQLFKCAQVITSRNFRFGILTADSGNGKTSFLLAGLLPTLRKRDHSCVYVGFTNRDPVASIRQALSGRLRPDTPPDATLLELLRSAARPEDKDAGPLVLLLDQFEQFFVHRMRKEDREPFIRQMSEWYNGDSETQAKLLISVRSEFRGRLDEVQKAMGCSLGPQQLFDLERFTPEEAAEIFRVLAESAQLECDRGFIEEMTARELASTNDGRISPVDIQILAWMITVQSAEEERAFTRRAFEKIGGVEGLMERFLTGALEARGAPSRRQAATKVLLALTDLERNTRAGALTLVDLRRKLSGAVSESELTDAAEWLTRGDVRLAVLVKRDDVESYELAHERLIPALRRIANKELTEADRANLLLDRRANEWQGSNREKRYLFSWRELRLIGKQTSFLQWGQNRGVKKALIGTSKRRFRFRLALVLSVVLALTTLPFWWSLLVSSTARILNNQWVQLQLTKLDVWKSSESTTDNDALIQIAKAYATREKFSRARGVVEKISDESSKALALGEIARVMADLGEKPRAIDLLKQAQEAVDKISDERSKAFALPGIANAMAEIGEKQRAIDLLNQSRGAVEKISDEYSKARALGEIARVMADLGEKPQAIDLLKQSQEVVDKISDEHSKASALGQVARAMAQIGATQRDEALLEEAKGAADKISDEHSKAFALGQVARAMAQIGATQQAINLLKEAQGTAEKISDESSKASAMVGLLVTMADLGPKQEAINWLKTAQETVKWISDEYSKAILLVKIARDMAEIGEKQQAIDVLKQSQRAAEKISDERSKASALLVIAKTAAAVEDFRLARDAASKQDNEGRKLETLALILETWARSKDPRLADKIWESERYGRIGL